MTPTSGRKARPRKKLTLVHKNNVLVYAGHLWKNIFDRVGEEYPEVTTDYLHVDAATIFLVTEPARFDVIVTDNLFGDIITDLAAAVTGGIGLAASGNINPTGALPVHVRAGSRLRPRHRGHGQGRPDRDRPLRRPAAAAPRLRGRGRRASRTPSPPTWPSATGCPYDRRDRRRPRGTSSRLTRSGPDTSRPVRPRHLPSGQGLAPPVQCRRAASPVPACRVPETWPMQGSGCNHPSRGRPPVLPPVGHPA